MVYRLTPQIISLQKKSSEPVTVYIDSPGGATIHANSLHQLLSISQQDEEPRHFITVATSQAASAAADLLAAGSYCWAYPDSTILYHGLRTPADRILTVEETLQLAERLKAGNAGYASDLAQRAGIRAMFRFIMVRDEFDEMRKLYEDPDMDDLDCLTALLAEKLSPSASEVMDKALERHGRYDELLTYIGNRVKAPDEYASLAKAEAAQIKAIIDFEVKRNKHDWEWRFLDEGMNRVADDFFLFHEYIRMFMGRRFLGLCDIFANFLLTPDNREEIHNLPEEDRAGKIAETVRPILQPIWSYFVALCHVLQAGENQLNGLDAFWLGLIDDVVGVRDLPSFRVWSEGSQQVMDEEENAKQQEGEAPAEAAAGA
jgi:hypothetical protein